MCVRCGTGKVAWCTSPDNHASAPGWDKAREARFSQLIDASLTGFMGAQESQELRALKAARDRATAEDRDKAATLAWLGTLRRKQLRKVTRRLAECDPHVMRMLTAARKVAEQDAAAREKAPS